jgi:CSLREA domain-containing protein
MKTTSLHKIFTGAALLAFAGALFGCTGTGTLTVNSNNDVDDGTCDMAHCSLREAIHKANTMSGMIQIHFDIGGGGSQTIQPLSALPDVNVPVVIDGSTQPGFTSAPLIELDGSLAGGAAVDGLVIKGGGSTVQNLVINRFSGNGIRTMSTAGSEFYGNYIGTDRTGLIAMGNQANGMLINGDGNHIGSGSALGGPTPGRVNIISGNFGSGIVVESGGKTQILGNVIGLDVTGTAALGNQVDGVTVNTDLVIIRGNIVSANARDGVRIEGGWSDFLLGNYVGTNAAGTAELGNGGNGVNIVDSDEIDVGGLNPGEGNVISGNHLMGVNLDAASSAAEVLGNSIGTNAAGTAALGNGQNGIRVDGADHKIGSADDGSRNLISGNGEAGIQVLATAVAVEIKNNYIGTDATGTAAIGNAVGIVADSALGGYDSVAIGGAVIAPNQANVISGNTGEGMVLYNRTRIWGNKIGTNAAGTGPLGNGRDGILVKGSGNLIGSINSGNTIAYNGGHGVAVVTDTGGARFNTIQINDIYQNTGLGIAIDENTVIPNDPLDADSGDNERQNYPVLNIALADMNAGTTTFKGELDSAPATSYEIEFFSNAACDPSGYGEGQSMFYHLTATTDAQGHADFTAVIISTSFIAGNIFTLTATDPAGNTSGFSNCVAMTEVSPAAATPMPAGLTFTPFADPAEIFYGRGGCTPNEVRIGVEIGDPPEPVSYLLLFVRLFDPETGEKSDWGGGFTMLSSGENTYFYDLLAEDVPHYQDFADAILQYQFVAYNGAQAEIGRSEVYGDIAFKRCGVAGADRNG